MNAPPPWGQPQQDVPSTADGATLFFRGWMVIPPSEPVPSLYLAISAMSGWESQSRAQPWLPAGSPFHPQCSLGGGSLVLRLVARCLNPGAAQLSLYANRDHRRPRAGTRSLRYLIGLTGIDIHRNRIRVRATLLLLALLLPYAGLGLLLLRWHACVRLRMDLRLRMWQHVWHAEPPWVDLHARERNAIVRQPVHGRNAAAAAATKPACGCGLVLLRGTKCR